MVENIYEMKNKIIEQVEKEMREKGADRIDPEMVDMIKDLSEAEKNCWEAEYYRSISESMESGYTPMMDGYGYGYQGQGQGGQGGNQGGSGYPMGYRQSGRGSANQYGGSGGRRGYSGYHDNVESLRMAMENADPTRKEEMKRELKKLME